MANRKPRRGSNNVLVTGDTGPRQPQHGAHPGATESGDLQAREFGVPQADLPGGVKHLVNPEAKPHKILVPQERPDDYHKYHGVPSDDGQYYPPPYDITKQSRPLARPKWDDAVPVYEVESPGKTRKLRRLVTEGPVSIPASPADPLRLANRDPDRVDFWITNENSVYANGVRIGSFEDCADNRGLFIPGGGGPQRFHSQDTIYVTNTSGGAVIISWGYVTMVPMEGLSPAPTPG